MIRKFLFIAILLLGTFLRFNQLGLNPPSLDWDEASLGYNAYALFLTGHDEYGYEWPLSIRSFGDYKPPAYVYLDIIPVAIFGLTEYAVRFPSALIGSLTIISVYFLTKEFFKKKSSPDYLHASAPLITMALFAIAPWPLQFSRAAFEGNIAVFLVTTGMLFFMRWMTNKKPYELFLAAFLLVASLYAYHAARLVVPLLVVGVAIRYHKLLILKARTVLPAAGLGIILLLPLAFSFLGGSDSARFSSVSVFKPTIDMLHTVQLEEDDLQSGHPIYSLFHNRRIEYGKQMLKGYLDHYNVMYMFFKGDIVNRHHAPDVGLFYAIELIFIIIGIYTLIKTKFSYKFIFFYWAFLGPLPAAISTGTPHAIRSILTLPIPYIAIAVGIIKLYEYLKTHAPSLHLQKDTIKLVTMTTITAAYLFSFTYYLIQYYYHQPVEYAFDWQYGYKQMVDKVEPLKNNYEKIIITNAYDQPYIYFLFYGNYDPRTTLNNGKLDQGWGAYEFRKIKWEEDRYLKNTLLIGTGDELPKGEPAQVDSVQYPDGTDAFRLIATH